MVCIIQILNQGSFAMAKINLLLDYLDIPKRCYQ